MTTDARTEIKLIEWPSPGCGRWWVTQWHSGAGRGHTPLYEGKGTTRAQRKQDAEEWRGAHEAAAQKEAS